MFFIDRIDRIDRIDGKYTELFFFSFSDMFVSEKSLEQKSVTKSCSKFSCEIVLEFQK